MFEPRLTRLLSKIQGSFQWNLNWKMLVCYKYKYRQDSRYSNQHCYWSWSSPHLETGKLSNSDVESEDKLNLIFFWEVETLSTVETGINCHLETENKNIKLYLAVWLYRVAWLAITDILEVKIKLIILKSSSRRLFDFLAWWPRVYFQFCVAATWQRSSQDIFN